MASAEETDDETLPPSLDGYVSASLDYSVARTQINQFPLARRLGNYQQPALLGTGNLRRNQNIEVVAATDPTLEKLDEPKQIPDESVTGRSEQTKSLVVEAANISPLSRHWQQTDPYPNKPYDYVDNDRSLPDIVRSLSHSSDNEPGPDICTQGVICIANDADGSGAIMANNPNKTSNISRSVSEISEKTDVGEKTSNISKRNSVESVSERDRHGAVCSSGYASQSSKESTHPLSPESDDVFLRKSSCEEDDPGACDVAVLLSKFRMGTDIDLAGMSNFRDRSCGSPQTYQGEDSDQSFELSLNFVENVCGANSGEQFSSTETVRYEETPDAAHEFIPDFEKLGISESISDLSVEKMIQDGKDWREILPIQERYLNEDFNYLGRTSFVGGPAGIPLPSLEKSDHFSSQEDTSASILHRQLMSCAHQLEYTDDDRKKLVEMLRMTAQCEDPTCDDQNCKIAYQCLKHIEESLQINNLRLPVSVSEMLKAIQEHSVLCDEPTCTVPYCCFFHQMPDEMSCEEQVARLFRNQESGTIQFMEATSDPGQDEYFQLQDSQDQAPKDGVDFFVMALMGQFGNVALAEPVMYESSARHWSIKRMKSSDERLDVLNQFSSNRTNASIPHSNIVLHLWGLVKDPMLYVCTEYFPGIRLRQCLRENYQNGFPLCLLCKYLNQVLQAAVYLDLNHIMYLNWQGTNIMVCPAQGTVKLYNFAYAIPLNKINDSDIVDDARMCLPPYLLPPEIYEGRLERKHSEVYGLGCLMYEMASGVHAFYSLRHLEWEDMRKYCQKHEIENLFVLKTPALRYIVASCCRRECGRRPSMARLQILADPSLLAVKSDIQFD